MTIAAGIRGKLLGGGGWALLGRASTSLLALLLNILLARLLEPAQLGIYFLSVSVVSFSAIVAQWGLGQTAVRFIAEHEAVQEHDRALDTVLSILLTGAVSALLVALVLGSGLGYTLVMRVFGAAEIGQAMTWLAMWALFQALQGLVAECFRGLHAIREAVFFNGTITSAMIIGLLAVLTLAGLSVGFRMVLAATIAALLMNLCLSVVILFRRFSRKVPLRSSTPGEIGRVVMNAGPIGVNNVLFFALTQVDLWILGAFRSQEEVALYGAAVRLVMMVTLPLLIINAVVPPIVAELSKLGKHQELQRALQAAASVAGIPAILVQVLLIFWGAEILSFVYGSTYRDAAQILAILCAGRLIVVWTGSCQVSMMMMGYQTSVMVSSLCTGALTVAAALLLVENVGGEGVALAAAAGLALQNLIMWLMVRLRSGVWTHMGDPVPLLRRGMG